MASAQAATRTRKPLGWKRIVGYVISIAIVVAIFVWAIPKFADYRDVWAEIKRLTPIEIWSLVAATIFNLVTYWWANQAALPGLGIGKAAVLTQTTTSVANTLPAGGAIAIGLTYEILDSWGFSGTSVALYVGVTGIWNIFSASSSWAWPSVCSLSSSGAKRSRSRSGTGWVASCRGSGASRTKPRSRRGAMGRHGSAATRSCWSNIGGSG